ncbi:hypothetical protein CW711_03435 [Candidatus Bathyarchaeota archaeon]|nr:MAG: hypothetical protein CW711_03435 [Candidatus Bathyarchaeota archaeon]
MESPTSASRRSRGSWLKGRSNQAFQRLSKHLRIHVSGVSSRSLCKRGRRIRGVQLRVKLAEFASVMSYRDASMGFEAATGVRVP